MGEGGGGGTEGHPGVSVQAERTCCGCGTEHRINTSPVPCRACAPGGEPSRAWDRGTFRQPGRRAAGLTGSPRLRPGLWLTWASGSVPMPSPARR